jgi:hypothetical protein
MIEIPGFGPLNGPCHYCGEQGMAMANSPTIQFRMPVDRGYLSSVCFTAFAREVGERAMQLSGLMENLSEQQVYEKFDEISREVDLLMKGQATPPDTE